MATLARPWLPDGAIARGAAALPLAEAVRDWAATWFAGGGAVRVDVADRIASTAKDSWFWSSADDAAIGADDGLVATVAALMIGKPDDGTALTADDVALLARVAEPCLGDLRRRIGELVGVEHPWRPVAVDGPMARRWRVSFAGRSMLTLAIGESAIIRRVRATMPPAAPPRPTQPTSVALAAQLVDVSARIGGGRITTAELAALGIGDVVVLDRAVDQPVEIAIERRRQPMRCAIAQDGDRFHLTVQP